MKLLDLFCGAGCAALGIPPCYTEYIGLEFRKHQEDPRCASEKTPTV